MLATHCPWGSGPVRWGSCDLSPAYSSVLVERGHEVGSGKSLAGASGRGPQPVTTHSCFSARHMPARVSWLSLRLLTFQPSDGLGSHTSALKFNGAPGSPQGLGQLPPFSASSIPHQGPGAQAFLRRLLQLIWIRGGPASCPAEGGG